MNPAVAALVADWDVSLEEATARLQRQDSVANFADFMATTYPLENGGMWIDHENNGIVGVAVLKPGIAMESASAFGLADLVSEVSATRTMIELSTISSAIGEALIEKSVRLDTKIDVQTNRVVVTIPEDATEDQQEMASRFTSLYGSAVDVRVGPLSEWFDDVCSSDTSCDSMRGGLQIVSAGFCSTGFVMVNSLGQKRILTAGHCLPDYTRKFKHNNNTIGGTVISRDSGDVDARTVEIDYESVWSPKRWVYHQAFADLAANPSFIISSRATNASIMEGTYLCRTGYNSNTRCGVIEHTGANSGNNTNIVKIHACALGGDSGGSYYDYFANKAYGTHIGSSHSGPCPDPNVPDELSAFSPIQSIENALSVTVFTGS